MKKQNKKAGTKKNIFDIVNNVKFGTKVRLFAVLMGLGALGLMHGQVDPGFYPGEAGYGYTSDTDYSNKYMLEQEERQRLREQEQGRGNWVLKIPTANDDIFIFQLDGKTYVIYYDKDVEIILNETNRERVTQLDALREEALRDGRIR
jgi:hypothetical protein